MQGVSEKLLLQIQVQIQETLARLSKVEKAFDNTANKATASGKKIDNSFQSQIKNMNKINPLLTQQSRAFVASENAKQKALQRTIQLQQKQQSTISSKIKNAILPGMGAGIGIAGVGLAIQSLQKMGELVNRGINFNKLKESATAMFTVMIGGTAQANNLMGELQAKSLATSMNFQKAIKSSTQLLAYGFDKGEVVGTLETLNTIVSATGGGLDDLSYVYGTLRTQGKAYSRDLMQFAMRGIPIYEELANVMGVTATQMLQMVKKGDVDIMFSDVEQAFKRMTQEGGVFYGASEARLKTLAGLQEQSAKYTDIMLGKATEGFAELEKSGIMAWINITKAMTYYIDEVAKIGTAIGQVFFDSGNGKLEAERTAKLSQQNNSSTKQKDLENYIKAFSDNIQQWMKDSIYTMGDNGFRDKMQVQLDVVSLYAQSIGASMSDTAKVMVNSSLITQDAFRSIELMAENMKIMKQDELLSQKDASSDLLRGELGRILEKMNVRPETYGSSSSKSVARPSQPVLNLPTNAEESKAYDKAWELYRQAYRNYTNSTAKITSKTIALVQEASASQVDSDTFIQVYKNLNQTELENVKALANRIGDQSIISDASKIYQDGIENAIRQAVTVLTTDSKLTEKGKTEWEEILKWLTGELKKAGGGSKLKADPQIWADLEPTTSATGVDDLERQMAKRIEEITKAYEGSKGSIDDMNKSITATTIGYENQITALQEYEDKAGVIQQIELAYAKKAQQAGDLTAKYDIMNYENNLKLAKEELDFKNKIAMLQDAHDIELATELHLKQMQYLAIEHQQAMANAKFNVAKTGDPEVLANMQKEADAMFKSGDVVGSSLQSAGAEALSGTDLGAVIGGANPIVGFIMALVKAIAEIENVSKTLNFIGTTVDAVMTVITYLFDHAFQPIVNILEQAGEVIGQILSPFIVLIDMVTTLAYLISFALLVPLQVLGNAFEYISDFALIPFANGLIDAVNEIAKFFNDVFGTQLRLLDHILTSSERLTKELDDEARKRQANDMLDLLKNAMEYLRDKIKKEADKTASSLQKMYEVGAISGSEYARRSEEAYKNVISTDDKYQELLNKLPSVIAEASSDQMLAMYNGLDSQKTALETAIEHVENGILEIIPADLLNTQLLNNSLIGIKNAVLEAKDVIVKDTAYYEQAKIASNPATGFKPPTTWPTATGSNSTLSLIKNAYSYLAGIPQLARGTSEVPNDMLAMLHKGEKVTPKKYVDNEGSGTTNVYVTVSGSVQAENDLAVSIANAIYKRRKAGVLTL